MTLTDTVLSSVRRACGEGSLKKCIEAEKAVEKFHGTTWGKTLAVRKRRENMTDFERFTVGTAKKGRRFLGKKVRV